MKCPHCNASIPYNATTCGHCGQIVPLTGDGRSRIGDYWSGVIFALIGVAVGLCGLIAVYGAVAGWLRGQGPVTGLILGVIGAGMFVFGCWVTRGGVRVIRGPRPLQPQRQDRV